MAIVIFVLLLLAVVCFGAAAFNRVADRQPVFDLVALGLFFFALTFLLGAAQRL